MKKYFNIILLSLFLILSSACSVDYKLNLKNDITEKITISFDPALCYDADNIEAKDCEEYISLIKTKFEQKYNLDIYELKVKENENKVTATFTNKYDSFTDFTNSNISKLFFINKSVKKGKVNYNGLKMEQDYIKELNLPYSLVDKFDLTITSKEKLKNTNADMIRKNEYYWDLKSNSADIVKFDLPNSNNNSFPQTKNHSFTTHDKILVMIGILSCSLLVVIVLMYKDTKNKKQIRRKNEKK